MVYVSPSTLKKLLLIKLFANSERVVAQLEYASVIGGLMYVMYCTCLGISYAVCKLSRYRNNSSIA